MAGQGNLTSPKRPIGDTQRPEVHWGKVAAVIGAGALIIAILGILATLHWRIADTETDLGKQIHKESTEIRELVGENAKAIGKLEGEFSGLRRQVENMDRKLDRALEMRRGEGPSSDRPVKHSQKR